jgi:putative heme-binding domain-containing protein
MKRAVDFLPLSFFGLWGCLVLIASNAFAQRALTEIPNSDPAYELSLLEPAEGFEINLFAQDPMIAKPTAMAFDSKGRLFVACTPIYPHVKPGVLPSDQIIRLEDTDHDGVADKSTVFADGLLIPTAILPNPDGVYVGNSTELLFFEDKDDDGVAETRRVIFSGFGTEDTHHILHTLRNGPAGRIYWNQSLYTHSHIETPYGYRDLQAGGVWQLRPETLELEVYARGMVNSWGLQFDRWGQSFQSDGAGFEGLGYSFPGAAFVQSEGYEKFLRNLNPGQPKLCGLEIIDGPHFPDEWQGLLVTNDFRGNRISSFQMTDSNSGYISRQQEDLVTSTHGAFRPIDVQNGPDGALYVADWYNPIIQHGEVDFRDERRDHEHGRIWRITAKGRPLQKRVEIASASVAQLLELLKATNAWTRDHAKRQLKYRGAEVVLPALDNWIKQLNRQDSRYEEYLREALWVSQSLDSVNRSALDPLLASRDFHARAVAVRVLEERPERYADIYDLMETAITDEAPRVRNEAIQVLRKLGTAKAVQLSVKALDQPMDDNLDFSLWNMLRQLEDVWLPLVQKNPGFLGDSLDYLLFAIRSVESIEAIQPLEKLWKSGAVSPDDSLAALTLLAERGNESTLQMVLAETIKRSNNESPGVPGLLRALQSSSSVRGINPSGSLEGVLSLLSQSDVTIQEAAAKLVGAWKFARAINSLKLVIANRDTNNKVRAAAVQALVGIGSRDARSVLSELAESDLPTDIRIAIASGYAQADPKEAVSLVVELLEGLQATDNGTVLILPYIGKPQFPQILANALKGKTVNTEAATLLLRRINTASIDTSKLQNALQKAANIKPVNQVLNDEELKAMIQYVETNGDPVRGETIYRRSSLLCSTCHAIGGAGGTLGPDFTSIGASAPVDYLIESLLQPQKQIKEGFHVVMVTKKDGSVAAGRLASQNETTITLQDAADQLVEIPKSDIASQEISPISLMPPGLTLSLRQDEFADLIKFMSRLGKEGDFKITPNRFVRTFRYLDDKGGDMGYADSVRHKPMEYITSEDPLLIWLPTYSQTNGMVLLDELPALRRQGKETIHYLRFQLDAKTPGDAILRFNDSEGLYLFVEGEEIEAVSSETRVTLNPGINNIFVGAHAQNRRNPVLRIEVLDAPDSSAQIQVVTGK